MNRQKLRKLLESAKRIANNECNSGRLSEFPPKLNEYWAKKENKNWTRPSEEVNQKVQEMYQQGQGYTNRSTHYTAEQTVSEFCEDFLSDKVDQKVVVTVQTLKSKFSQWLKKEKMAADKGQKSNL